MATRWLKVEVTTPNKLEVKEIARRCKCSRADAFLALFYYLTWADEMTDDGYIAMATREYVDEEAKLPGFSQALEAVNWAQFGDSGMQMLNWERHNGQSAKKRMVDAERQRKHRATQSMSRSQRDRNVT